jgi:hypothetical protein
MARSHSLFPIGGTWEPVGDPETTSAIDDVVVADAEPK